MPQAKREEDIESVQESIIIATTERNRKALDFIEHATIHAAEVQAEVLLEILTRNAYTEYLERYQLTGRTDRKSFKERLPVITYEDLQPDRQQG